MSVFLLVPVFSYSTALAKVERILGPLALKDNPNIALQVPETDAPEIILSREQYVISYNKERRTPNWVAWKVEQSDLGSSGRSNNFAQDPDLENYLSQTGSGHAVTPEDYRGSCFDRGHQAPSADRTDSLQNNEATFLMSNMIPQTPYLNRVIWEHLENYTRSLVHQGKKVYVIAGPIYDQNFGAIGPQADIQVPSKDFKIIIVLDANQTPQDINANTQIISVVMPNTREDGTPIPVPSTSCEAFTQSKKANFDYCKQYQTSLLEIQTLSGVHISLQ
ncbi:MAG: DNA/RNA non-specific endonuclease [Bacillota bacterium]